jgi:hypothetical protein
MRRLSMTATPELIVEPDADCRAIGLRVSSPLLSVLSSFAVY